MTYHKTFAAVDYILFGLTLAASAGVGIFFSCWRRQNASPNEVLMGGRKMPIIPTALSLATSFISGITLLALPAETYQRGILYYISRIVGSTIALLIARFVVLPTFFQFRPTSANEYFEYRFGSLALRRVGAVLHNIYMLSFMGVVLYAPSVALSGVTGVRTWIYFLSVGLVCIVYTAYGGLKAVVWADSLQAMIILVGVLALFFKGAVDAGGVVKTLSVAAEFERFSSAANFSLNPFQYMTLWTSIFGGISIWLFMLTFNQIALQRYLSLPSLKDANKIIAINIPVFMFLMTFADLLGVVMFAYFKDCDPLTSGQIETKDQLVIIYALEVFDGVPGMPGIFLASLLSGTLSTVSSGINSLAAVTWEDFLKQSLASRMTPARQSTIIKLISVGYGSAAIGLAFLAEPLGGTIKTIMSVIGATAGPLTGLFLLGILFPRANKNGAFVGLGVSFMVAVWICVGNSYYQPYKNYSLPLFVDNCSMAQNTTMRFSATNRTFVNLTNHREFERLNFTTDRFSKLTGFSKIFGLSDMVFSTVGLLVVLLVGMSVSLVWNTEKRLTVADANLKEVEMKNFKRTDRFMSGHDKKSTEINALLSKPNM